VAQSKSSSEAAKKFALEEIARLQEKITQARSPELQQLSITQKLTRAKASAASWREKASQKEEELKKIQCKLQQEIDKFKAAADEAQARVEELQRQAAEQVAKLAGTAAAAPSAPAAAWAPPSFELDPAAVSAQGSEFQEWYRKFKDDTQGAQGKILMEMLRAQATSAAQHDDQPPPGSDADDDEHVDQPAGDDDIDMELLGEDGFESKSEALRKATEELRQAKPEDQEVLKRKVAAAEAALGLGKRQKRL
jgi:hypothetical protein